ncbi:hypothetical protein SAY87_031408 [Trapa incisa]|uniref:Uncharacterized protein n=1 Tax=Trapa incisa TaxID=236973 RepID=A0AAN7KPB4_9MYRT|nr:hypothetical protein SAY87_031408 [Trapa incisa]
MSNNKEDKTQDVAERIKAAALSAAKGLSRAQAEKAAAIAARNLNWRVSTMSEVIRTWSLGHWTCECKNERVYISRPSRTQMLKNPNLNMMGCVSYDHENLDSKKEEKA